MTTDNKINYTDQPIPILTNQLINNSTNQLINQLLHLADNALILGHRNSEWCGHGPVLEQDIAITNISLDLVGQARNFYQCAAELINRSATADTVVTEDTLAYHRDAAAFKNWLLAEQPNGDWAMTITRQFFFSTGQYYLYEALQHSKDQQVAAIAAKALKEVTYHVKWSSDWVIRLGDGTEESKQRMEAAVLQLAPYTKEMFGPADFDAALSNDPAAFYATLENQWQQKVNAVFAQATLTMPAGVEYSSGGKDGKHSPHLQEILSEMQVLQRAHPGANW
jgi:ring-1,2-phenylacetyl-CoA epoxidase subunit PaaC